MTDPDIVTRLRNCVAQFEFVDRHNGNVLTLAADEIERLRKELADAYSKSAQVIADLSANLCTASALERERLTAERDEARQRMNSILTEIDCRIEHGAESNGHLEVLRDHQGWFWVGRGYGDFVRSSPLPNPKPPLAPLKENQQ